MSQFFKALEQAERDRLRQEEPEAPATPQQSRMAPPETPTRVVPPAARDTEAVDKPVGEPSGTRVELPSPAPVRSESAPPPPRVSRRPVVAPDSARPVAVFRDSLRKSGAGKAPHAARQPRLVVQTNPDSIEAEAYRTLRTNVQLMADGAACRHIAITSVAGGDGKSTTAANLAVVTAQAGHRVCVVDADLRRPTLHEVFGLRNVDGLVSALEHGRPLHAVAQATDVEGLSVVVAGRSADESAHHLLTSQRLENLLRQSEGAFDLILFDSPPVMGVADALSLAAVCDGVVLVVRVGSLPFNVLKRAVAQLTQVKGRVLGVLLNRVNLRATDSESYSYVRAYHSTRPNGNR